MLLIGDTECTIATLFELLKEVVQPENLQLSFDVVARISDTGKPIAEINVGELIGILESFFDVDDDEPKKTLMEAVGHIVEESELKEILSMGADLVKKP
jgi:hypothetical protein